MGMNTIILSLGSNIGEREEQIDEALRSLRENGAAPAMVSSRYETAPVGLPGQPDFINIACTIATSLSPFELLDLCEDIERKAGRTCKGDSAPRILDIDIVFFGQVSVSSGRLILPHPEACRRRFVLLPLREILPEFVHPLTGERIDALIKKCPDKSRIRLIDRSSLPEGSISS